MSVSAAVFRRDASAGFRRQLQRTALSRRNTALELRRLPSLVHDRVPRAVRRVDRVHVGLHVLLCGEWIESTWDCMFCCGFHCVPFFLLTMIIGNLVVRDALRISSFCRILKICRAGFAGQFKRQIGHALLVRSKRFHAIFRSQITNAGDRKGGGQGTK